MIYINDNEYKTIGVGNINLSEITIGDNSYFSTTNEYVINVSTQFITSSSGNTNRISMVILTTDGCSVTFNGETQTLTGSTSRQEVLFSFPEIDHQITGDMVVIGQFSDVGLYAHGVAGAFEYYGTVNNIVKWYKTPKETLGSQFINVALSFDVNIPYAFTRINSFAGNKQFALSYTYGGVGNFTFNPNIESIGRLGDNSSQLIHRYDGTIEKRYFQNAEADNTMWYINNIPVNCIDDYAVEDEHGEYSHTQYTEYTIRNGTTRLADSLFDGWTRITSITFNNDGMLTQISENCCQGCTGLTTLTIPSSVNKIGDNAFKNTTMTSIRFEQPLGMSIELPTAGSTYGMLYNKTAKNMNVYTDNQTIHDYDYSADNVTPTFYHLDGTLWEV